MQPIECCDPAVRSSNVTLRSRHVHFSVRGLLVRVGLYLLKFRVLNIQIFDIKQHGLVNTHGKDRLDTVQTNATRYNKHDTVKTGGQRAREDHHHGKQLNTGYSLRIQGSEDLVDFLE